jgi:hypothetical protein
MEACLNLDYLRIPMVMLYRIRDPEFFTGLSAEQVRLLPRDYSPEELAAIVAALAYASAHPGLDYQSILPDLPCSNHQVHAFLVRIHDSIAADSAPLLRTRTCQTVGNQ